MKKAGFLSLVLLTIMFASEALAEAPKLGIGARGGYNFYRDGSIYLSSSDSGMVGKFDYSNNSSSAWTFGLNGTLQIHKYFSTEIGIDWINSSDSMFIINGSSYSVGEIKQIPVTLTTRLQYPLGVFSPYFGFGIGYYFRSYDKNKNFWADATNVNIDNGWGYHINGGSELFLTQSRNFALNVDLKYIWSSTEISARNGATWLRGNMKLDSFLIGLGIKYYF